MNPSLRARVKVLLEASAVETPTVPTPFVQELVRELLADLGEEVLWRSEESARSLVGGRRQSEEELQRLNLALRAMIDTDRALARAVDEAAYLDEICRIIVEDCGYALVWIGLAEHDEGKSVRPVASAGFEAGYLETLHLSWADTERGRGPTGTAIRTGRVALCRDMHTDPQFEPWRAEAQRRGYASSAVLPLLADGRAFGALNLYRSEPDGFGDRELALLSELAAEFARGITTLRLRAAHAVSEAALRRSEERYRSLFGSLLEGFAIIDVIFDADDRAVDYRFIDVNPKFEEQTGLRDVIGKRIREVIPDNEAAWYDVYGRVALTGEPARLVSEVQALRRWFDVSAYRLGGPDSRHVAILFNDVSGVKRAERERDLTIEFLRVVNSSTTLRDLLGQAVAFFQQQAGCEAVGVRLKDGDDFPYVAALGFSPEFLQHESSLCVRDPAGRILRDAEGAPVLVCRCGDVICGRFDPSRAFFTPHGTFWTNGTTGLAASPAYDEWRVGARNRCNREGHESMALVPLFAGGERLGLLQLNDPREGAFSAEAIDLWERLAGHLAVAMAKLLADEAVRATQARFHKVFDHAATGIAITDCAGRFVQCNAAYCELTGYTQDELLELAFPLLIHPDDRAPNLVHIDALLGGQVPSFEIENRYLHKDGSVVWVHKHVSLLRDEGDSPTHIVALVTDTTERKQADDLLRFLGQCGGSGSDEGFFHELARYLAQALDMSFVCIDRLEDDRLSARTLAVFHDGQFEDNVAYALKDTPCGDVVGKSICRFPCNVRALFPRDAVLQDLQAESYLGTTLWGAQGDPIGLIAVIGRQPLASTRLAESVLQVVSVRAAAELERRLAEEQIKASLAEKEVLLKEIHHRVKNNLQVVSSLVSLQVDGQADPAVRELLGDVRDRVRTMALVHEKLYGSANLNGIEFAGYTKSLLHYLWRAYSAVAASVRLTLDLAPAELTVQEAVPCGLILNELASNALKHAFRGREGGEVTVSLRCDEAGRINLRMRDDGVGLPAGLDWRESKSLGLRLVRMLAGQLGGVVEARPAVGGGTEFELAFERASGS